jgi:DNA segregation ATPase FtsK/SpoIIIE-like protein
MAERHRSLGLLPRAVHAAWGWRLEAGLVCGSILLLRLFSLLGPGGDVLLVGTTAVVLWRVGPLRRRLGDQLRQAAVARRIAKALVIAEVLGPYGFPKVGSSKPSPGGVRVQVRVPLGRHTGQLEEAAPTIAAALRAREVRVVRDPHDASLATVEVLRRDPFARPPLAWPWANAPQCSLWHPIPLGVDEVGRPVSVGLPEHNLLLGGEPGAGKSAVLSLLVAASALDPDVTLSLLDAKQVELAPWNACAETFVGPDTERAVEVLENLRTEMDLRYQRLLAEGRRKIAPGDGMGIHVVAVDELAFFLRGSKRAAREAFGEGLRDLVSRGRAAGIVVVAATQKPSHDVIPTSVRDLFSFRLALRCTTPEASDTVLGQGWAAQGYSAALVDPATRGVGLLLAEGGVPVKLRASYLDDEALFAVARRAATLRREP